MAWHKAALLIFAAWPALAFADEARCPADNAGAPLKSVSVFDGPLSEQADLVPDDIKQSKGATRSTWQVAYVYAAGRPLFVSCGYGRKAIVIKPAYARVCVFDQPRTGAASFACK